MEGVRGRDEVKDMKVQQYRQGEGERQRGGEGEKIACQHDENNSQTNRARRTYIHAEN